MPRNKPSQAPIATPPDMALPSVARTRGGRLFSPTAEKWELQELTAKATISFDKLSNLDDAFKHAFKATLAWYAQNESLHHVNNIYERARHLFEFKYETTGSTLTHISSTDILNYKGHLGKKREWYLGSLTGFLKRWHNLGHRGITEDANTLLHELRISGNEKGVATATMDPIKGPFSSMEFDAIQRSLNDAYTSNELSLSEYVLCWLFIALGLRPTQCAALKVCDVVHLHGHQETATYLIRVPRAKTRDGIPRGQFKDRLLTPQLGKIVVRYADQVKSLATGLILDPTQSPLFPSKRIGRTEDADDCHLTANELGRMLTTACNRLKVLSERTGKTITINPRRFRSTLGTRAAEEGHGELVIAELLDHTDTQNVGVYVGATPAIVDRIDRAVAMQLAPLAQAFSGKLIDCASHASRREDPTSLVRAPAITGNFSAISSCGKHGFCGFLKPIACYTCKSFEPWVDGPHDQVLDYLISERQRLMKAGDQRIASINDRTILAVAEVVKLCETARTTRKTQDG